MAVAAAAAISLSCSREADMPEVAPAGRQDAAAQKGIAISFSAEDMEETRSSGDRVPVTSFGVFAIGSLTGDEVMSDQKVSWSDGAYRYSPLKYFPDGGLDFMAYAPYGTSSLGFSSGPGLPLDFTFSLPSPLDEDIVLAGPLRGIESDVSPVILPFRHPLTRIRVSFSINRSSLPVPEGKGLRITSVSLSHCIREGEFDAGKDAWTGKGGFVSAVQECRTLASAEGAVEACSFYSVPFTAPEGTTLHIEWEAFNIDSDAATRRYSTDVDLAGRDFSGSQCITASIDARWYADTIEFEDPEAEAACVAAFDADGDGALSYVEAESVTDLGDAFRDNDRISLFNEFRYFTGLTQIEGFFDGPFAYMDSLKEITLPPNLTDVGGWPFCHCPSLEKISVAEGNPRYYSVDGCLFNSRASAIIRVPESVPIENFEIPSGIRTIGYGCFEGNMTIEELTIGADVTSIANESLRIYNLRRITVAPGSSTFSSPLSSVLYSINSAGEPVSLVLIPSESMIFSLTLPSTIKSIGNFAVYGGDNLRGLTLNEGLESIGMYALNGVSLGDLVIPSTVTSIGKCALRYITLRSLTVLPEIPPVMGEYALPLESDDQVPLFPVYVSSLSYTSYLQAPVWGTYPLLSSNF